MSFYPKWSIEPFGYLVFLILNLLPTQVHAENGDIIAENQRRLLARGVTGPEGHPAAQPQEVEEEAVRRACSLALGANVPLVVCAPSSPDVVAVIAEYQARGLTVLGEARGAALAVEGSHYFNQCWSHAAAFVASPPLREGENVPEELVNALKVSTVNLIITILSASGRRRFGFGWKRPHWDLTSTEGGGTR